jgi:hypothetical protein
MSKDAKNNKVFYDRSLARLREMVITEAPAYLIQSEARLLLEASYGGPWKLIWALVKKQVERKWR